MVCGTVDIDVRLKGVSELLTTVLQTTSNGGAGKRNCLLLDLIVEAMRSWQSSSSFALLNATSILEVLLLLALA